MQNKKRGFTLFELLVSISIIGILTAIAAVSYSGAQKKARDSRRIQDMGNIQKAAELYYSQNKSVYPLTSGEFITGGVLQVWPTDPKNSGDYVYTGWSSDGATYCYCVEMDSTTGGNADVNHNCTFVSAGGPYFCVKNQQ